MSLETLFRLDGKTALVTGGASGIGFMAAEGMVRAGAHVLLASRKAEACASAAERLNGLDARGSAEGLAGDVSTSEGVKALARAVEERVSCLSILMNNAGQSWGEDLGDFSYKAWDRVLSVNVTGLFMLSQALLGSLEAAASDDDPARIVNVGSVMGDRPIGDGAYSYAASKAAVHHITAILAKELASRRITVNALAPGPFVSKMTAFALADVDKRTRVGAATPLGRVGRAEDIVAAMLYLCGRGGAYVTGAILPISGGINVATGDGLFAAAGGL